MHDNKDEKKATVCEFKLVFCQLTAHCVQWKTTNQHWPYSQILWLKSVVRIENQSTFDLVCV